jgi:hypothetical protein
MIKIGPRTRPEHVDIPLGPVVDSHWRVINGTPYKFVRNSWPGGLVSIRVLSIAGYNHYLSSGEDE